MPSGLIRILNFDDSLPRQKNLIKRFSPSLCDFREIGPAVRSWMNKRQALKIRSCLQGRGDPRVNLLGSGDFHHLSALLLDGLREQVSLIIFDFHPDWDTLPPRMGCGSWVSRALENKNILKVIQIGVSSADISTAGIWTANLKGLENQKLEIFPYRHCPTRVCFRRVPRNPCLRQEKGLFSTLIHWTQVKDFGMEEIIRRIISRLPTDKVYLSIDKDCLKPDYALTNWESGYLDLGELLIALRMIREKLQIIGLDICGEFSPLNFSGRIKGILSRLDHPKDFSAAGKDNDSIDRVNESTNIRILESLRL